VKVEKENDNVKIRAIILPLQSFSGVASHSPYCPVQQYGYGHPFPHVRGHRSSFISTDVEKKL
jgi:hypothetical protein